MKNETEETKKRASDNKPRWRIWTRVREPSPIRQLGAFGPFFVNGRIFGEDEYADFVDWVRRENQKDGDREHEIRPVSDDEQS